MVNWYVWIRALFVAFGGFTYGYDIGAINGVKDMLGFRQTFNLSYDQGGNESALLCDDDLGSSVILGFIVAVLSIGCFVGALLAGTFSDFAGRRVAIIVGGLLYGVGGILQTAAFFLWMMFVGRFIGGLGVGVLFTVVPVYIAEISPKELRGRLVSFISTQLNAGLLVGFVVNLICEQFIYGWRISLSVQILVGFSLAFGMLFLPETPRWLVKKHRDAKAAKVLARIHQTTEKDVEEEIDDIRATIMSKEKQHIRHILRLVFTWKCFQRLLIGMCLQIFQRAVGATSILYYSVSIFCKVGAPGYVSSVVFGVVVNVATVCGVLTIDKLGRKVLLLLGGLGMLVSMVTSATLILVFRVEDGGSRAVGYIVVAFICFFMFAFTYGWGAATWVVNGEMHALEVRGIAVSLTGSAYWVTNVIVAQVTPVLLASTLQTFGTFYLLVGVHIAAILFVLLTLPETKGETLERIELLFSKPWLERINLAYYLRCGCLWFCCTRRNSNVNSSEVESQDNSTIDQQVANTSNIPIAKDELASCVECHTPV